MKFWGFDKGCDVPFQETIPWGYWMTLRPKIVVILRCHLIKNGIFQWMVLDDPWYFPWY